MTKTHKLQKHTLLMIALTIIVGIIALDQHSKYVVLTEIDTDPFVLLPFLNITTVWNSGISFGLLANAEYSNVIFGTLSSVIVVTLIYLSLRYRGKNILAYSLIIGGGIANILDRITYGAVFDFIDFHLGEYHWPAFNIADSAIFLGIVWLFFNLKEE